MRKIGKVSRWRAGLSVCAGIALGVWAGLIGGAAAADTKAPASAGADAAKWEWCGWGGGGYFWSCASDPADPQTIYLGGDVNGVCKSVDQGRSWRMINNGLANYEINSLLVDPHNSKTLYAFTAGGLCKSVDGGEHWRLLPQTAPAEKKIISKRGTTVRAVAVDGVDGNLLYAGTPGGQLFRSRDGGEAWEELALPVKQEAGVKAFSGNACLLLTMKADAGSWDKFGRAEKVYGEPGLDWSGFAGLQAALFAPAGAPKLEAQLVVQSGSGWLWQQGDFAELKPGDWTAVKLDLSKLKDLQAVKAVYVIVRSTESGFHGELKLDAVTLTGAAAGQDKVLADWERAGDATGWGTHKKEAKFQLISSVAQSSKPSMSAITGIAADPVSAGVVYAATSANGVFKSVNAGQSWQPLGNLPQSGRSLAIAAADPKTMYAAMGAAGLYKSTDGGASWEKMNLDLPAKAAILEAAISRTNPQRVYCIAREGWDGRLFVSSDGGKSWAARKRYEPDFRNNPTLPQDRGALSSVTNLTVCDPEGEVAFVAANWANVITRDGGKTLQESAAGADISCVHDIRFHNGKAYAAAMDEGLLESSDQGKTWKQLSPLKYHPQLSGHCWRVNVSGEKGKEQIVATISPWDAGLPNKVIRSAGGEPAFEVVTSGMPEARSHANCMWGMSYARALAADPKNPQVLYMGIDGDPEKGNPGGGVFKSVDGGQNWQQLAAQPGSRRMFYALEVDPTDSNRIYWGACNTGGGVYLSEDAGGSWKKVFSNETWVFNLMVTADGTVYAGGKDLWRSRDHGKSWQKVTKLPASNRSIVGMAYDPQNPQTLWISAVGWSSTADGTVYKTTDGGATWEDITNYAGYVMPLILRFNPETRELWAGGVGIFKLKQ